jgi:hypothetical protein
VPFTKGFASWADLSDHFTKHVLQRREFNVATEAEYEALADAFLGGPMDQHTEECVRPRDHDKMVTPQPRRGTRDTKGKRMEMSLMKPAKLTLVRPLAALVVRFVPFCGYA